jgi:hypothetical protein
MPRPYGIARNEYDPVEVVGHDHEGIQLDTGKVDGDLQPACGDDFSGG